MEQNLDLRKPGVIRPPDHRLRVFISSTLNELAPEREAVRKAVLQLHMVPVMFEAGARPHPARRVYQAYLAQSHVFIGIYWQSYGWAGNGSSLSGIEDEYNLSGGRPRLIYIKTPAPHREAALERLLGQVEAENAVCYKPFASAEELGALVANDLALLLAESYEIAAATTTADEAAAPAPPAGNLLHPRNPLLGRESEQSVIREWLTQPGVSLVVLTGAAGVGKSRLALDAALRVRGHFRDGAFLVRLTPISDPSRVMAVIAETIGLRDEGQGESAEDALVISLREKQMLLLLDNFEQLMAAAPRLAYLTETCPGIKLLVTSRISLHLRGERELRLAPLATPGATEVRDWERLSDFAAIELLVQRTRSSKPDFGVGPENFEALAHISRRLDGLPLALELAAPRLRLLTPDQLLQRLRQRFDVLAGASRDLPQRQQTLRTAIDWSYDLLDAPAQLLFRRLAVFSGGWSIKAAEAVCNASNDLGPTILPILETLIDCSLVSIGEDAGSRPRFGMLESIREYAHERLAASDELDEINRLHVQYYLGFVQAVEPRIRSADRLRWQAILQQEFDNVRSAMDWALRSQRDLELGQELAIALVYFWLFCGPIREGMEWCERFSNKVNEDTKPAISAGLLGLAGGLSLLSASDDAGLPNMAGSLELARKSGDRQLLANCLLCTGAWALSLKSLRDAWKYLSESMVLFEELNDRWSQVLALNWLANVAFQRGQRVSAENLCGQCLVLAREQGDPWLMTVPLLSLAQRALAAGARAKARSALLEVEPVIRSVGAKWHLAWALNALGLLFVEEGAPEQARPYLLEALQLARENGNVLVQCLSLVEAAALLAEQARRLPEEKARRRMLDLDTAGRMCGVSSRFSANPTLFRRFGAVEVYDSLVAKVQSTMSAEAWECAHDEGTRMSLGKSLDYAASVFASA